MEIVIYLAAGLALSLSIVIVFAFPFRIGKEKTERYTAELHLLNLVEAFIFVVLAGHAFGWW